jgi:hypothetical protein
MSGHNSFEHTHFVQRRYVDVQQSHISAKGSGDAARVETLVWGRAGTQFSSRRLCRSELEITEA